MPRIRSVKPEYFTHPNIVRLSIPARLLLISLWNQADDEGRLYDQPKRLCANAFGEGDKIQPERLVAELAAKGRIVRYESESKRCILVYNFTKHQRIDKPSPSNIPAPLDDGSPTLPGILDEPSQGEGKGRDRKGSGKEGIGTIRPAAGTRRRDEAWEAFIAVTHVTDSELSAERRKALNGMLGSIKRHGGTAEEIYRRAEEAARRWPDIALTPEMLTRRWAELGQPFARGPTAAADRILSRPRPTEGGDSNGADRPGPSDGPDRVAGRSLPAARLGQG